MKGEEGECRGLNKVRKVKNDKKQKGVVGPYKTQWVCKLVPVAVKLLLSHRAWEMGPFFGCRLEKAVK